MLICDGLVRIQECSMNNHFGSCESFIGYNQGIDDEFRKRIKAERIPPPNEFLKDFFVKSERGL